MKGKIQICKLGSYFSYIHKDRFMHNKTFIFMLTKYIGLEIYSKWITANMIKSKISKSLHDYSAQIMYTMPSVQSKTTYIYIKMMLINMILYKFEILLFEYKVLIILKDTVVFVLARSYYSLLFWSFDWFFFAIFSI